MAQDTNGVKDAGPWITAAHPTYTGLIDEKHLVSKLYNMVKFLLERGLTSTEK